jgi:hypothetical protein
MRKNKMRKIKFTFLVVALMMVLVNVGWGQTPYTATYTFTGTTGNVASFDYNGTTYSGISPSAIAKVGVTTSSSSGNFRATGWPTGATDGSNTFTGSVDLGKYIEFSIVPVSGYKYTITSITFGVGRSATGVRQWQWRGTYDTYANPIDNYSNLPSGLTNNAGILTNTDANSSWNGTVLTVSSNYSDLTSISTFRLYAFNSESTSGTAGLQGPITITGTYSATTSAPSVTTTAVSSILSTGATFNGNITSDGGASITERGFCYKTSSGVTISDNKTSEGGTAIGSYSKSFTLSTATNYFYKAYATNSAGTTLSSTEINFWTFSTEPTSHSTTFSNTVVSQTQINLSFDAVSTITNGLGYIILKKTGSAPTGIPTDGNAYSVGNTIGDATVAAIVTNTSATSQSITGLSAGTTYYFTIMPYNYNGANNETYNYRTSATIPGTNGKTQPPNDVDSYVSNPLVQLNPITISSLADTDPEAVEVFKFKITDVGTDLLKTKVNQITINAGASNTANWTTTIQGVKLSIDGGSTFVTTGTATISATSIVFPITSGNLDITNGSSSEVSLFIYLKSSGLTDNQVLQFNVPKSSHGFTADVTGSTFLTSFADATTSNTMTVNVEATKFNFSTQPSNTTVNTNFSAGVEATDVNGNRDLDALSITLSASAGTLSSVTGLVQNTVNGLYLWTDLQNNTEGTGVTLSATGTITTATSNTITVFASKPTIQASAIVFSNIGLNSMTVSWTNGNGANRIVVAKASGTPGTPTNGTSYTASTVFGSGSTFGASEYVVYNGTGSTVDITGLTGSTTYTFKVFEYNGGSGTENYLTTSNATSQTTLGTTYYSIGSGDPTVTTNWKTARDGSGTSPSVFTAGETFVIQNTHTMTTSTTWSISGTNSKLWIENGGTLIANNAITLAAATTFQIDNGGTYIHNNTTAFGSSIFQGIESFAANSTVEFRDWNTTGPSVTTWGNVKFNATGTVTGSMQLSGNMTTINGNLEVIATGSGTVREIRFATTQAPTINIAGNFTQTAGIINLASTSGVTVFNVAGNFAVNGGTFTSTSTGSKVVFNGTGAQTFTNAGTISVSNFELNNSAGLTLNSNLTVTGTLTMTTGRLSLGANTLTIDGNLNNTTPTVSNIIVLDDGTNFGTLNMKVANNQAYSFYVGDTRGGADFTPATVTFSAGTSSSSYLALTMKALKDDNNSSSTDYLKRSWIFTPTNLSSPSYTIELDYVGGDVVGTENNIWFGKYNGGTWTILNKPNTSTHIFTSSTTLTSFSTFTGGTESAMPVELSSFTANINERNVNLNWITANEQNNAGFEVQKSEVRSQKSDEWVKVAFVNGNGTKNTPTNYSFEDKKLNTGKYNYRLKQIDYNGNFEYFDLKSEVEIGVPKKFNISQNYPNPFNPVTKIDFDLPFDSKVSIRLYDITGREIKTLVNETKQAGYYTTEFNGTNLASGLYFYRIVAEGNGQKYVMTKKALLIK